MMQIWGEHQSFSIQVVCEEFKFLISVSTIILEILQALTPLISESPGVLVNKVDSWVQPQDKQTRTPGVGPESRHF